MCALRFRFLNRIIPANFAASIMPSAYSEDLHWRVVRLYINYNDVAADDIACFTYISERSVFRYVEQFRTTGEVTKCCKTNGPACVLSEHESS